MKHTHGFPAGTDVGQATRDAVREYRKLGGTAAEPLVEHSTGDDGELLIVVRSEPRAQVAPIRRLGGVVVKPGDVPAEMFEMLRELVTAKRAAEDAAAAGPANIAPEPQ